MCAYIKNPIGRITEVSEERPVVSNNPKTGEPTKWGISDYEGWLNKPGFTKPSQEEIDKYVAERKAKIQKYKADEERIKSVYGKEGVYFVTVSQGGKDGYSIASKNLYTQLQKLGVNISFGNTGQKIALLLHAPYSITRLESPIRILYTMFESTKIPQDWIDYLEQADRVLVPSQWCAKVFENAGIKAEVVPLGYDDETFKFIPREPKKEKHEPYTFLHYNAFNIRKGFLEVFKAFAQEFQVDEPVKMIFKTTLDRMPIPISPSQYPNIEVITGQISDPDLIKLMARSDCFVYPSRGEGFGIPPLEAMATGLPTIVANSSGMTEYFNADFMYEAKFKEMTMATYSRYKKPTVAETVDFVGEMYVSDIDDIRTKMRYVYEHEKEALAKGQAASFYVKQWTFKKTAEKLKAIIDEMGKKEEIKRPLKNILRLEALKD